MKMIWLIVLVFTGCQYLNFDTGILSSIALTPTPVPNISLFDGDTCTLPCWLVLTPGESTTAEVLAVLESHSNVRYWADGFNDVFDRQSGLMIDGDYLVQWLPVDRYLLQYFPESRFVVRESILSRMEIYAPQIVPVDEVLAKLGQPNLIRFGIELYREPIIIFEYHTIPLRAFFTSERATCENMVGWWTRYGPTEKIICRRTRPQQRYGRRVFMADL